MDLAQDAHVTTAAALERDRALIDQTAARFTDAAGVAPNIASVVMGHPPPEPQPGADKVTLARRTHALLQAVELARVQLSAYLSDSQKAEVAGQ